MRSWTVTLMFSVLACGGKDRDTSDDSMVEYDGVHQRKSDDVQQNAEPRL